MLEEGSIMTDDIKDKIALKSVEVLRRIKADPRLRQYICTDKIPSVFMDTNNKRMIRLIVIGQDPTVKKEASREKINTVLNLDKPHGSLYKYLSQICEGLGLDLWQHVYATNFAKNFFTKPPAQIKECNVLFESTHYWLPLLQEELSLFPNRLIITLGQPLLSVLLLDQKKALVHDYWGYTTDWARTKPVFSFVPPEANILKQRLFPFPHQPSSRKNFYSTNLRSFLTYVRNHMTLG
jgi:uracil-DNA glycosylase